MSTASSNESRRRSSCEGKERFAEGKLAQRVATKSRGRHGKTYRKRVAYPCVHCGGWHVGSPIKVTRAR